jgi:hypothetical protein
MDTQRSKTKPIFNHLCFAAERRGLRVELHTGTRMMVEKKHVSDETKYFYRLAFLRLHPKADIDFGALTQTIYDGNLEGAAEQMMDDLKEFL